MNRLRGVAALGRGVLLATFVWREDLGRQQLLAFVGIWLALVLYTRDFVSHPRRTSSLGR